MNNDIAIGIEFGDNDFYNTLIPFMANLQTTIQHRGFVETMTRDELRNWIVKMFSKTALSFYILNQSRNDNYEHLQNYFNIKPENVYIGEEVGVKAMEDYLNGEFFFFYSLDGDIEVL
jgi:hypothetical protein